MHRTLRRIISLNPSNSNKYRGIWNYSFEFGKRKRREALINIIDRERLIIIPCGEIGKGNIYIEIPPYQELEFQEWLRLFCA